MTTTTEPKQTTEQLAHEHMEARARDIRDIMERQRSDNDEIADQAYEDFYQYGLSFDYVAPYTFSYQRAGYWRWQISWGGPAEEFRVYVDKDEIVQEIDFVYLDWGIHYAIPCNHKAMQKHKTFIYHAINQLMEGR